VRACDGGVSFLVGRLRAAAEAEGQAGGGGGGEEQAYCRVGGGANDRRRGQQQPELVVVLDGDVQPGCGGAGGAVRGGGGGGRRPHQLHEPVRVQRLHDGLRRRLLLWRSRLRSVQLRERERERASGQLISKSRKGN
jgi:hypothetical protein